MEISEVMRPLPVNLIEVVPGSSQQLSYLLPLLVLGDCELGLMDFQLLDSCHYAIASSVSMIVLHMKFDEVAALNYHSFVPEALLFERSPHKGHLLSDSPFHVFCIASCTTVSLQNNTVAGVCRPRATMPLEYGLDSCFQFGSLVMVCTSVLIVILEDHAPLTAAVTRCGLKVFILAAA